MKTLEAERPTFINVIKAVPADNLDFKPHEKARTARSLMVQLATQPGQMSKIIKEGLIGGEGGNSPKENVDQAIILAEKNFGRLMKDLAAISDKEWETAESKLVYPGGEWKVKKFEMAWGFLFDGIHHRGQLSTYIRIMGGKVPSIYGGSADARPGA